MTIKDGSSVSWWDIDEEAESRRHFCVSSWNEYRDLMYKVEALFIF